MDVLEKQDPEETANEIGCSNIAKIIASLCLSEKFSDISFDVDGEIVYAHKVILAARSAYFEKLLFGDLKEADQEEIQLPNISINAFRTLLTFIYTDSITVTAANLDLSLQVLDLANQYLVTDLEMELSQNLVEMINPDNVCQILQRADLYNFPDLYESCLTVVDENALEFLESEEFNNQSEKILSSVFQRDSFKVPEVKIFKAVVAYYKANSETSYDLLKYIRFSSMTIEEIYFVVLPTKLVDNDVLIKAIGEAIGVTPRTIPQRWEIPFDVNVATLEEKAVVLNNENDSDLDFILNGNEFDDKFGSWPIGGEKHFTVKLKEPTWINNINIRFSIGPNKYYRYYVETSSDGETWRRIIDYSNFDCRASQKLYFEKDCVHYIKVVGTYSSANDTLDIVSFKAFLRAKIPKLSNGIICSYTNVALSSKDAIVIEGSNNFILGGDIKSAGANRTWHNLGEGSIIIQLAQPYMIDSIMLWLCEKSNKPWWTNFYIEGSTNRADWEADWETLIDKTAERCKSWQFLDFEARPLVYIKIRGTHCGSSTEFSCHHIQCFAKPESFE